MGLDTALAFLASSVQAVASPPLAPVITTVSPTLAGARRIAQLSGVL